MAICPKVRSFFKHFSQIYKKDLIFFDLRCIIYFRWGKVVLPFIKV